MYTTSVTLLTLWCVLSSSKTVSRLRLEPLLLKYSPPKIDEVHASASDGWKFTSLNLSVLSGIYWHPDSPDTNGCGVHPVMKNPCRAVGITPDKISWVRIKYPRTGGITSRHQGNLLRMRCTHSRSNHSPERQKYFCHTKSCCSRVFLFFSWLQDTRFSAVVSVVS